MKLSSQGRRGFAIISSVILLTLAMAACGGGGGGSTPNGSANGKGCTKVGVLLPETATSARWDSKDKPLLLQGIKTALPSATIDYSNAGGNDATQLNQAEADLTKGDCILVVAATNSDAAAAIVSKAHAQNVPVIAYDRLIQSKDLAYYVSFDNTQVGKLQGQYVASHHKKGDNIIMINGSQDDNNALLFNKGALLALQPLYDSKDLNLKYTVFTPKWNNDTARTEMDGALTASQNNIQIAYVANDGMANSVIASLKAQHLNGKVLVTGQDATVAGIQNILTGDQAMTVYKAIPKEAQATASLVAAISNGTSTASLTNSATTQTSAAAGSANIPSILETPVIVDKTNIATTVIADGFVTKAEVCQGLPAGTGGIC